MDDFNNLFGLAALSAAKVSMLDQRLLFVRRFVGAEQPSIHEVVPRKALDRIKQHESVSEKVAERARKGKRTNK